ncbi:hypothetical protein [Paenibacillus gallinarum]|uniref:Uncharacterized protein n=1 Tax=Paenibacillus gallinarum TaxID=2762232 RepID=A0ABR8T2C3_9BACL|nr:hypothetical protein [Paenibacillus gallinarum]MBD7969907.1 hypothetical protein [Paenibacillus gallinarum]
MRKFMLIVFGTILIIMLMIYLFFLGGLHVKTGAFKNSTEEQGVHYAVRVSDDQIERYDGEKWSEFVVKGISLSDSVPNKEQLSSDQLENKISTWLDQISKMNVNTIRIPSIQSPALYSALYEFNKNNQNPIYIIHDIPIDEDLIDGEYKRTKEEISKQLQANIEDTIDVVHGRKMMWSKDIFTSRWYANDISPYVLGYVIGNSWDSTLVKIINKRDQEYSSYDGKYVTAESLNGFEYIMAQAVDYTAQYETEKYNQQRLVSFLNTTELDPIIHSAQSSVFRDTELNIEKFNITNDFHTGIFASYQASPNDTDFLNISLENSLPSENEGSFEAYLQQLKSIHQKPIVITNIGLSTSRGMSKEDEYNHYSRGGMTEEEQGTYLTELLDDIYQNQYAGAIIYNWQDEWQRSRTWNTRHIKNIDNTENWLDVQSSEQHFGIMQFVPSNEQAVKVDGITTDWNEEDLLYDNENGQLYAKYDPSYLYLMIQKEKFHFTKDHLHIAIDVNPSIGTQNYEKHNGLFNVNADFVARIQGVNDSDIQVQSRYNIFDFRYKYYANIVDKMTTIPTENTNTFDPIYLLTRNVFQNDGTMEKVSPKYMETGTLTFGSSDYDSNEYNSLADFYVKEDVIELRIPWLLINVIDPIGGIALGDFYKDGINAKVKINQIGLQVFTESDGQITKVTSPSYISLKNNNIQYQERTKESYEVLQAYFENVDDS